MEAIKELIELSHYYGADTDFVIGGGGNTSMKNADTIWVKASGTSLGTISESGFAVLDRKKLAVLSERVYSSDALVREQQVKEDLFRASLYPERLMRPSVETSMHNAIGYKFVVHTHPTLVNAVLCSAEAEESCSLLFGEAALYIPYTDPGYVLFKAVEEGLQRYRSRFGADPQVILLQNHGIFVAADTAQEVHELYAGVLEMIENRLEQRPSEEALPVPGMLASFLPACRMMLSAPGGAAKIVRVKHNQLVADFYASEEQFESVSHPFTPDGIVYCKARPLYLSQSESAEALIAEFSEKLEAYRRSYGYDPKILMIRNMGLVAVEDHTAAADTALEVFYDVLKVGYLTANFGGPHPMNQREIAFIDNWEVENYRRAVAKGSGAAGRVENRIAIVTGGAQGFGAGIVESLFREKANVVIADLNDALGRELEQALNSPSQKNRALFVKSDVSDPESVRALVEATVLAFGGVDLLVSNAGILRAGGLDEMTPETFSLMTRVNYMGYFFCAKYVSEPMKLQARFSENYFTDIIQINSKSGLKGSNKNFAYAGGKFGGVGLTQSFALELMPYRIKVNAICPGNFFDGPLWADPEKGLFVQYLRAGKVPGAATIDDVKKYYEAQVPARRGCLPSDVMKALLYIVDQTYETGQAVPVTGGQNMLN